jgi:hypothetical protein
MAERAGAFLVLGRVLAGALLLAAIAWAGDFPVGAEADHAALRLSWRARARVQECRDRTAEELAKLPAHLRQPRECQDIPIDYHLELSIDGTTVLDEVLRHHGVRSSRPLFVDRTLKIAPGRRHVVVSWQPQRNPTVTWPNDSAGTLVPHRLELELELEPGTIDLITLRDQLQHLPYRAAELTSKEEPHA